MDSKCKICRRAGEKLFLKGERCFTPKCAVVRKPYPPGIHTRPSRRGFSEFGIQLREKQKLRNLYQIREAQFSNYVHKAMASKGADAADTLLQSLALRLDNTLFQAGFAQSRSVARQVVSHGHARVNGRKTTTPSYTLRVGDTVTLSDRIWKSPIMKNIEPVLQKYVPPAWIILDGDRKTATISAHPETKDQVSFNTKLIIEYYAR